MAATLVQQKALSSGGTNTFTMTMPGNISAGNTLALMGGADQVAQWVSSVVGGGVTWTLQKSISDAALSANSGWVGPNSTGGVNNVVATTNGGTYARKNVHLSEWSSINTTTPVNNSNSGTNGFGPPTPSIAVVGTGDMVLIASGIGGGTESTPTAGFTALTSGFTGAAFSYLIQTGATGTISTSWTHGGGSYSNSSWVMLALNVSSGGGIVGPLMQNFGQLYPMISDLGSQFASTSRTNGQLFPL